MSTRYCPRCHCQTEKIARFCPRCGQPLSGNPAKIILLVVAVVVAICLVGMLVGMVTVHTALPEPMTATPGVGQR